MLNLLFALNTYSLQVLDIYIHGHTVYKQLRLLFTIAGSCQDVVQAVARSSLESVIYVF